MVNFFLGEQLITKVAVDLKELREKKLPENLNAYGVFSLRPTEPFPVSDQYRAEVMFAGKKLGTYPFQIVTADATQDAEPPKDTPAEMKKASNTPCSKLQDGREADPPCD